MFSLARVPLSPADTAAGDDAGEGGEPAAAWTPVLQILGLRYAPPPPQQASVLVPALVRAWAHAFGVFPSLQAAATFQSHCNEQGVLDSLAAGAGSGGTATASQASTEAAEVAWGQPIPSAGVDVVTRVAPALDAALRGEHARLAAHGHALGALYTRAASLQLRTGVGGTSRGVRGAQASEELIDIGRRIQRCGRVMRAAADLAGSLLTPAPQNALPDSLREDCSVDAPAPAAEHAGVAHRASLWLVLLSY